MRNTPLYGLGAVGLSLFGGSRHSFLFHDTGRFAWSLRKEVTQNREAVAGSGKTWEFYFPEDTHLFLEGILGDTGWKPGAPLFLPKQIASGYSLRLSRTSP